MSSPSSIRRETYMLPTPTTCELAYELDPEILSPISEWLEEQHLPASAIALLRFSQFLESDQDWDHQFAYISTLNKTPNTEDLKLFTEFENQALIQQSQDSLALNELFFRWVQANWAIYYRL